MSAATATHEPLQVDAPLRAKALKTLPEQIAERVFAAITRGEHAPGERIREEALAEQFGVSRGPVREALRLLEKDSVVRILPNRGAHVTELSAKEVGDIFEIRRDLVAATVRRMDRADDAFVGSIGALVRELEVLSKDPSADEAYLAAVSGLDRALAEGSGNERLAEILSALARQTRRYSKLGLATEVRRRESASNWRTVLQALESGDMAGAACALEGLIDASRHEAVRQLRNGGGGATPGSAGLADLP